MARPVTRFLCRWVPRRTSPRRFTRTDAARVVCKVLSQNPEITIGEVLADVEAKCGDGQEGVRRALQAQAMAQAGAEGILVYVIGVMAANAQAYEDMLKQLTVVLAALTGLVVGLRLVPGAGRLAAVPVAAVRQAVQLFEGRIIVAKAANDEAIQVLREFLKIAA